MNEITGTVENTGKELAAIGIGPMPKNPKKYPEYLQAVEDFIAANPKEGELVSHEWLDQHLDLDPMVDGYALRKLKRVDGFRKELLVAYKVDLKSVLGKGYYIVPSKDQTRVAMQDQKKAAQRAIAHGLSRVINVRLEALTDGGRKANEIAIETLNSLSATVSKTLRAEAKREIKSLGETK